MPYKIVKQGEKFCVAHEGKPISGGCHADRKDAVDHLQAMYAKKAMAAVAEAFCDDSPVEEIGLEEEDFSEETPWSGYIAFEGVATGDNRSFASESITWNDLPVPFLWQKTSSEGHSGSWVIGRVDTIERHDGGKMFATGVLLDTAEGREYKALVEAGAAGGCSIDGDSAAYSVEEGETKGQHKITFSAIRIRALTAVAIPAFADAKISLTPQASVEFCDDITETDEAKKLRKKRAKKAMTWTYAEEGSLTAAALVTPPSHWFDNQQLPGPTPLTVLPNGQVFGHLGLWGTCHIGMPACTAPPKGGSYAYFHTGALTTLEGDDISVGHLTFNTGHASVYDNAFNAASHYDHTGAVAADVVAGEDKFGIWVAGSMRPHLTEEEVRAFKSAPISGDWRRIGARLELVAALSVNTPGFPVPRNSTRTKVLVASGQDEAFITVVKQGDFEPFGRQAYKEDLAERVELKLAGKDTEELAKKRKKKIGQRSKAWTYNTSGTVDFSIEFEIKTPVVDGEGFPASDYAYVGDPEDPSTWMLRLTSQPGGDPDPRIVGAAIAALGKGFRGQIVTLSSEDAPTVKNKITAAWKFAHPDAKESDIPTVLK